MTPRRKLIEVALPLEAINVASVQESYIYRGNPSTLHKWWAQRPMAAARAVIFAQMVDDPSSYPDLFPTAKAQEKERKRLFRIIEKLVLWENTTNEEVLQEARNEIWASWRRACSEHADHPRATELFDRARLPTFHDPFAGGGTLPLEAQRLGLEAYASDLNPVAVLINKAMIEVPPKFARRPPVNPEWRAKPTREKELRQWRGAQGLAEDVRYYGQWMRDEAEKRIGHLYPKIQVTAEMATGRADLAPYVGRSLTVLAWIWARTVRSPNPAFATVDVPLASTFMLSTKSGKEAYIEPVVERGGYRFTVKVGKPKDTTRARIGTKLSRGANFECLMSGTPIEGDHIKAEGMAGRLRARMMAIVAQGDRGRIYIAPTPEHEVAARDATHEWSPEGAFVEDARAFTPCLYGFRQWQDLFTERQLSALTTFSDLVGMAVSRAQEDATNAVAPEAPRGAGLPGVAPRLADALTLYLSFIVSKITDYNCALVPWYTKEDRPGHLFSRQAIPMVWDYAEVNPLSEIGGSLAASVGIVAGGLAGCCADGRQAVVAQADAVNTTFADGAVVSTDPPYYDNVPYADLSDFFYVWLRRMLRNVFPELFATLQVPKAQELVALAYRHKGGKAGAEAFFLDGMTQAMRRLADRTHPAFPVTIYYAFKQSETDDQDGTSSTGWETFLEAVIAAGFAMTGTWPMRTERGSRSRGIGANALASSIVLVCRPRPSSAPTASRREFVAALKAELPLALAHLQRSNIAPVDLAQAAIGPGMGVFTRHSKVLDAEGKPLTVREALALINHTLDESLVEQEGDFDADSRWALAWFEQSGFAGGEFGVADVLARAKNTSVQGMVEAGVLASSRGKVRLLKPDELPTDWDPATDSRLTAWEIVHQLVRVLGSEGEGAAAALVAKLGSKAEIGRELCYRLYTLCERKKRAADALSYNALVQSWPELVRLAREGGQTRPAQADLFGGDEE